MGRLDKYVRYRVSVENYGDGGREVAAQYTRAVRPRQLLSTFVNEMLNSMLLPWFARDVERQMQRMRDNNFPDSVAET